MFRVNSKFAFKNKLPWDKLVHFTHMKTQDALLKKQRECLLKEAEKEVPTFQNLPINIFLKDFYFLTEILQKKKRIKILLENSLCNKGIPTKRQKTNCNRTASQEIGWRIVSRGNTQRKWRKILKKDKIYRLRVSKKKQTQKRTIWMWQQHWDKMDQLKTSTLIFHQLKKQNADVSFLQETHIKKTHKHILNKRYR